jgi:pimeloyl-ACP methyl ester carboxylesterase
MDKDLPEWSAYGSPDAGAGISLSHSISGQGSPVLLIHGFGASSYSWRYVIEPLSRNHQVITLDLKGFGNSPKPRDDRYSVYDQARLVRNFIVDQNLKDLTIIGHSFGGGVALVTSVYLEASHPGLINKLVLIDNVAYPQKLPASVKILATPVLGPLAVYLLPDTTQVKILLEEVYFDDALIPQSAINHYAEDLAKPNAKYAILTSARQLIPRDLDQFSQNYARLKIPTLVIWSREDEMLPLEIGQRLHAELPNSELVILDNVGHAAQEENPALILPLLENFLDTD